MSFEFGGNDFDHFDPENPDDRILPGKYHLMIQAVDDSRDEYLAVDYEVLAGTVAGQEGKTGRERLYRSAKASKRIAMFLLAAKLTSLEALIESKNSGKKLVINMREAEGRQMCAELVKSEKGFINWSFQGIWAVDDDQAKDIPKNSGLLAEAGTSAADPLDGIPF